MKLFNLFTTPCAKFSVLFSLLALVASTSTQSQASSNDDRGPEVTIEGSPAAPCDVDGHLERVLDDGSVEIVHQGSTVAVTVKAKAYGHSSVSSSHDLNRMEKVALYGTKVGPDTIPYRPGEGQNDGNLINPPEGSHTIGYNTDGATKNCTWVFKWRHEADINSEWTSDGNWPLELSHTWNLLFYYSPGWYWYIGNADELWEAQGALSFWSAPLGAYHCLTD